MSEEHPHGEARSGLQYPFPRKVLQVLFLFNHDLEKLLELFIYEPLGSHLEEDWRIQ